MDKHTFTGKRRLGTTDLADFTDYQGVGHDPLYKRYATVQNVIKREIPPAYEDFLAIPDYIDSDDTINWYVPEWKEVPRPLSDLEGVERQKYEAVKEKTLAVYRGSLDRLSGEDLRLMAGAIRYIEDDFIFCADGKVYLLAWGMTPDKERHISTGTLVQNSPEVEKPETPPELPQQPEPPVVPEPPVTPEPPQPPVPPVAQGPEPPQPETFECLFNPVPYGMATGPTMIRKRAGEFIRPQEVPGVNPDKGYKFMGWNPNPLSQPVNSNLEFHAVYEENLPWYKRFWRWLMGLGWLKWLLLALLIAFLVFLILWLCSQCSSCHREINGVRHVEKVERDGVLTDDFGRVRPIELDNGRLPKDEVFITPPVTGEDGTNPEIIRDEGVPPVMANRLILFLEDDNGDLDKLAADFKNAYPGSQYQIIGFDKEVKSLVIQIPENERNTLRETLPSKLPVQRFIVFDEEVYELNSSGGHDASSVGECTSTAPHGWHLEAVKAPQGWEITKGSPGVKVAIVDDGIDANHPMFKGRIKDAYNVYNQSNELGTGEGHGTHVAALAVGSLEFRNEGAAGIAPECTLMPVQVFDHNMCPLSALVSGIMYAIHKDADVINVSVAPQFPGLNLLPPEVQNEIGQSKFKNVEKLWSRVSSLASAKNCIVVYAAGNDDILSIVPPENRTDFAITVGAVDERLYPTQFTNYGVCTDISAPGTGIFSAFPMNEKFKSFDGTSMAAPIVTGAIALMKTLKKDLTVTEARNVLYKTGLQVYGYMPPMVQVNLALEAVKRGDFGTPEPRDYRPVPEADRGTLSGDNPSSWDDFGPYSEVNPDGSVTIRGRVVTGDGVVVEERQLPWVMITPGPGTGGIIPGGTEIDGNVTITPGPGNGNSTPIPGNGNAPTPENGGVNPAPGNGGNPGSGSSNGNDDTEEIKRIIKYHKDKIKELEEKLKKK